MAITKTISNRFKYEKGLGAIDFSSDTFKAVLMADGFVFNKDSHGQLSQVAASIITSAGGYATKTLVVDTAWNQDNTNDVAFLDWENVDYTASGADFDDFVGMIIYDDDHADDVIVGCVEFGQTITLTDGNTFQAQNLGFEAA